MSNLIAARAALAAIAGLLASLICGAHAEQKGKLTIHNVARVYHPAVVAETKCYKKVGVVTSRKVFDSTPEYQQIAKRKLSPNTAEWCLLAKRASDKFRSAVSSVSKLGSYDLIAETGAVSVEGEVIPDVTSDVIAQLPTE